MMPVLFLSLLLVAPLFVTATPGFASYGSCPSGCNTSQQCTPAQLATVSWTDDSQPLESCIATGSTWRKGICSADGAAVMQADFSDDQCTQIIVGPRYASPFTLISGACGKGGVDKCPPSSTSWPIVPSGPSGLGSAGYFGTADCSGVPFFTYYHQVGVCESRSTVSSRLSCTGGVPSYAEYATTDCTGPTLTSTPPPNANGCQTPTCTGPSCFNGLSLLPKCSDSPQSLNGGGSTSASTFTSITVTPASNQSCDHIDFDPETKSVLGSYSSTQIVSLALVNPGTSTSAASTFITPAASIGTRPCGVWLDRIRRDYWSQASASSPTTYSIERVHLSSGAVTLNLTISAGCQLTGDSLSGNVWFVDGVNNKDVYRVTASSGATTLLSTYAGTSIDVIAYSQLDSLVYGITASIVAGSSAVYHFDPNTPGVSTSVPINFASFSFNGQGERGALTDCSGSLFATDVGQVVQINLRTNAVAVFAPIANLWAITLDDTYTFMFALSSGRDLNRAPMSDTQNVACVAAINGATGGGSSSSTGGTGGGSTGGAFSTSSGGTGGGSGSSGGTFSSSSGTSGTAGGHSSTGPNAAGSLLPQTTTLSTVLISLVGAVAAWVMM